MKTFDQLNAEYLARYKFNTVYNYYLTRIALLLGALFSWLMVRSHTTEYSSGLFVVMFVLYMGAVAYCVVWVFGFWLRPFVRVFSKWSS
jgi:hypothetical protein